MRINSTVSELLGKGEELLLVADITDARLVASILLANILKIEPKLLILKKDITVDEGAKVTYYEYIEKAVSGLPLGYITGQQNFFGYDFFVNSSTLIPRPETEELVEKVLAVGWGGAIVIDVGTGSGCIPVTLSKKGDFLSVYACDISNDALEVAKKNASRLSVFITFWQSDCTNPIFVQELEQLHAAKTVHEYIFTANLPYIPTTEIGELDVGVQGFEPRSALDGGEHGTEIIIGFLKNIMSFNSIVHKPIKFFLEIDPANYPSLSRFFKTNTKWNVEFTKDMSGHLRFVEGCID